MDSEDHFVSKRRLMPRRQGFILRVFEQGARCLAQLSDRRTIVTERGNGGGQPMSALPHDGSISELFVPVQTHYARERESWLRGHVENI